MTRDLYKPLRQAHAKALRLGRNREERRALLHGTKTSVGLVELAMDTIFVRQDRRGRRHKRRNRIKGC